MSSMSLMSIMRDDPDFGQRLSKKTEEIKADKRNILEAADTYGKQYQEEILKGTELRAKLLTEGASRGKSEEEIMASYGRFVPTVYTPIMNMLYFMLRESEPQDSLKYRRRDAINEVLIKTRQLNHDAGEQDISKEELLAMLDDKLKEIHGETLADVERRRVNEQFAAEVREKAQLKEPKDMETYLFGHLTLDQFNTLKKLKSLTSSTNIDEASLAFKKGKELAAKYKVDWDKIPCYYTKK
jgi:hypothetical protein